MRPIGATVAEHRSSKSYIDEGLWATALAEFHAGDYVLLQFGGNDQKKEDPRRYAAAEGDFKVNMTRFINDVRSKGANPLIATSVVRRRFDNKGQLVDTYVGYSDSVRTIARETHTPLLDMNRDTGALVQSYGVEGSKKLYMWVNPGEYELFPTGSKDDSHLSIFGAEEFAKIAARQIRDQHLPLAEWLK